MKRYPDWQQRLSEFLSETKSLTFQYGRFDCCLFVADAVLSMTGVDIASGYRDKYNSLEESINLIQLHSGSKSLQPFIHQALKQYNLLEVPVLNAQRGDIILVKRSIDFSLGLISLSGKEIIAVGERGIIKINLKHAFKAWRI
jgi:hypothetical protein